MEETALLAFGILVEEAASEILGTSGDLAFIEGEDAETGPKPSMYWNGGCWSRRVIGKKTQTQTQAQAQSHD